MTLMISVISIPLAVNIEMRFHRLLIYRSPDDECHISGEMVIF